jgi:aspartate/methionine/tyrosine aminotransferase
MKLETFAMERLQSTWENRVAWNLSESGVHPLRVEELAESYEDRRLVFAEHLGYPQTNGTLELRSAIAEMYPGATPDHVLVTNGGSEANCIALWHLLEPGDEVVMMVPNYMQVYGLASALGAGLRLWPLVLDRAGEAERWAPDLDLLKTLVTSKTKLILICNPNNPTGARLRDDEVAAICAIAEQAGAWLLSDEIYRGAELDGVDSPTVWGRYERAIVTSSLSKAYGLAGLRIGWIVGQPRFIEQVWGVHDYTTIAPGAVNDRLARIALTPGQRERLLARTRGIVRTNYPIVRKWIERRAPALTHVPPEAGAIAFVRFRHAINSTLLVERLRDEQSVLVVPGDHFLMDGYLRIGFGVDPSYLTKALECLGELLDQIPLNSADLSDAR